MCYIYLIFMIFAMMWLIQGNSRYASTYSYVLMDTIYSYILVLMSYFGVFTFGAIIAYIDLRNLDNRELWSLEARGGLKQSDKTIKTKKRLKRILRIICYFTLAVGVFCAYIVIMNPITYSFIWWMGMFVPNLQNQQISLLNSVNN